MNMEFDEIRPYHDEELPQIYEELIADPAFQQVASAVFPEVPFEALAQKMRTCKTKLEFQKAFCYTILKRFARDTTQGVTLDLTAQTDKTSAYTYISNHRDIILDSGFLSVELIDKGMDTVEIAIGDNLLIYPWMHHTIKDNNQSIWIAQREGRAKDSNDRTQESVLKMLAMGGEGDIIDRLIEMNILPLAISYEYDPCDYLKAQEFQLKRDIPDYKKTQEDDLKNMQTGLFGPKGRVHFQVASCINEELEKLDRSLSKPELFSQISALIDRRIHANYRMYPGNYIAHDYLSGTQAFAGHYTAEEKKHFTDYIDQQLARIELPNKDIPFLREKMLLMYANPLTNYLAIRTDNPK